MMREPVAVIHAADGSKAVIYSWPEGGTVSIDMGAHVALPVSADIAASGIGDDDIIRERAADRERSTDDMVRETLVLTRGCFRD